MHLRCTKQTVTAPGKEGKDEKKEDKAEGKEGAGESKNEKTSGADDLTPRLRLLSRMWMNIVVGCGGEGMLGVVVLT